jgi:hypothetical protein
MLSLSSTALRGGSGNVIKQQQVINKGLLTIINRKKRELNLLVLAKKNLQDPEVYRKSCELDVYIVKYMKWQNKARE